MSKRIVLFGAGNFGKTALDIVGKDLIDYFIDNDSTREGSVIEGIPVRFIGNVSVEELKKHHLIITVSRKYLAELERQIQELGITDYEKYVDIMRKVGRDRIENRPDNLASYNKAIEWIKNNTISENIGKSIINSSTFKAGYPEVTGYYIPTLIRWGYRDIAEQYADWLVSIQREDGAILNTAGEYGYVFDTAQVLKGLLAAKRVFGNKYDSAIIKGCEWILSNMQSDGRLTTPNMSDWGEDASLELIHIYCLSPIREAAEVFDKNKWRDDAKKIWIYYKEKHLEDILEFKRLIHFHAYLMEALLDIGEFDLAREGMKKLEGYEDTLGYVPAYSDKRWICSTGLFQLAIVWYRLGDIERGNKVFDYCLRFQNESGGWFGSYMTPLADKNSEENDYFSGSEISWANKFFLDALYHKNKAECEISSPDFQGGLIDKNDGRYQVVESVIRDYISERNKRESELKVLDAGCSAGRYLKNLHERFVDIQLFGSDISETVLGKLPEYVEAKLGTLTSLPYDENSIDILFSCEAVEHAVDLKSAVKEMARVVKPGGIILVIDKNTEALGEMEIGAWKQWLDKERFKRLLSDYCSVVKLVEDISYDGISGDTFCAWIGRKE